MKEIDARGLDCPAPVLQTRAALQKAKPDAIKVRVDNPASQENVRRFLESQGFEAVLENQGEEYRVIGRCRDATVPGEAVVERKESQGKRILVMCAADHIGSGDDVLGVKLMVNFIRTLKEIGPDLWRLVLVNNGVKLTVEESVVLQDLQGLEKDGLKILVCGTCLTHFDLLEKKRVGETTNMLDIVTAMQLADKVITI